MAMIKGIFRGDSARRRAQRARRIPGFDGAARLRAELLEDRRLLAVAALVDGANVLQVSITGTDTAQIGVNGANQVVVKDSTNAVVFTGPAASLIDGINVAPGGVNDIIDLTGVGASTEFTGLATVNVAAAIGATTFLSGSIATSGAQLYAPNVLLTGDTVLSSTAANIGFGGVIEANGSPHDLEIHSLGAVFSGNVGDVAGGELGLLTTNGAGITVINAAVIKAATLTFNDDVVLQATTALTGTTAVGFAKTINTDGTPRNLSINSPGTLFSDAVGGVNPLGTLTVDGTTPGVGTTFINTGVIKGATLDFNNDVVLQASAALTGTTAVNFAKTVNTDGAAHDLSINSPNTSFNGQVGSTPGNELGTLTTDAAGTTTINAAVVKGAVLAFNDDVVLQASATLTGATSVSFAKTLNSGATARDLAINSASTTFAGAVGVGSALNSLAVNGAADLNGGQVKTTGDQTYNGAVTLSANADLSSTAGNIKFLSTVDGTFDLSTTTAAGKSTTFAGAVGVGAALNSLSVNGAADLNGGQVKTVNDQTYNGAVTLGANAILSSTAGNIKFLSTVDGTFDLSATTAAGKSTTFADAVGVGAALNSLSIFGAVDLNGGPVNTVNDQTYNGAVTLSANANLSSTAGNIHFASTVDGPFDLAASALAAGKSTTFADAVGVGAALNSLSINGAANLNGGQVKTTAGQTYAGAVSLGANAALTATTVNFHDSIAGGGHDLTIFGDAVFGDDPADAVAGLLNLTVNGAAAINASSVTTAAAQTYVGAVTLGAGAVQLTSTGGGLIDFRSSVDGDSDGTRSLTVTTSGDTQFGDGAGADFVGKLHPLAALTTSGGGATKFNVANSTAANPTVTTFAAQSYGDDVVLVASAVFVGAQDLANITFAGKVDSAVAGVSALAVDTQAGRPAGKFGVVQFNGNVGATALASLTVVSGGPFTIAGGITLTAQNDISITVAESTPAGAGDNLTVNGTIHSNAGAVELRAGDNVSINASATLFSPTSVTIRGDFNNNDAPGGCTILLAGTITSPVTNVFGGAGNDTINVRKTTAGVTTIDAGGGNDVVNVSSTAPAPGGVAASIAAAVVVQGAAGADTLNVDDSGDAAANVTGELTATTVTGLGMGVGVTYAGLEQVNVLLGSGANLTFNVKSTLASTPASVTGKGVGTVNVGNGNNLDGVQGALAVQAVQNLNLNDQASPQSETYDISNAAVLRFGSAQALVAYEQVATLAINAGGHDDAFNLFLPSIGQTPLTAKILIDGGVSPPGFHNKLSVIASQVPTATGFVYVAHVGVFGSADPIQIKNIQSLYMYGAVKDANNFANHTAVPSVIIGGQNADTLRGGSGQDVIFGGGAPQQAGAPGDVLVAGGVTGAPADPKLLDFIFAEYAPVYQPGGGVTFQVVPGNGNTTIDAGGGSAVSLSPHTFISNATTLVQINGSIDVITWLKARFLGPQNVNIVFNDAAADPVFAVLGPPAVLPGSLPVSGGPAPPPPEVLAQHYVADAFLAALGRPIDPPSLAFWGAQLQAGLPRSAFTHALTHSDEYYGNIVKQAYLSYLGRAADAAGLAYWVGQMRDHGLTDERLEAGFIGSQEYFMHAGGTNLAWVDQMYLDILGRPADAAGEAYWVAQINAGAQRADVAYGFAASLERERQRVEFDYVHYLGRTPDAAGVDYWVNQFAHGETNENLVAGFLASDEYYSKHAV